MLNANFHTFIYGLALPKYIGSVHNKLQAMNWNTASICVHLTLCEYSVLLLIATLPGRFPGSINVHLIDFSFSTS